MRIVIDLQAAQSPDSRHRGIGRYSIALARAMLRHRGDHEILIALNGMFTETVAPVREAFSDLLAPQDIRVWHATLPAQAVAGAPAAERRAAELVRESFLASLEPDIVHVASMFESALHAVTGIHKQPWGLRTAVTLYDLIPHIYPDVYLPHPAAQLEYQEKLAHLRSADLLLAISEYSRREAIDLLGMDGGHVVAISSAADEHFTPGDVAKEREAQLRAHYELPRPFVMYTGGIDHRKNIEGLIGAWAALPHELRWSHQLTIVGAVQGKDRLRLEQLVLQQGLVLGDAVLTGFVPEDDLLDLYRLCKLFVFPSRHEGFGLPVLEAMRCGAPVIGADNSSIPEVIGRADALFDAGSQPAMTAAIARGLTDDAWRATQAEQGLEQAARFSWDASAQAALRAMEALVAREGQPVAIDAAPSRPRLALVSPLPPSRSGIADSSADLLPELAAHYDIDLIVDQPELAGVQSRHFRSVRDVAWFAQNGGSYDRVLYQFGNSAFHDYQFDLLRRHPGVVILHDFYLSGVLAHRELHGGHTYAWTRELYASHGWHALAERVHTTDMADIVYRYPANFEVLRRATGVIVHSQHAMRLASRWYDGEIARNWALVPLLRQPAPTLDRAAARQRLGLRADAFVVCSFGHLGPIKLNARLLRAWRASALSVDPDAQLVYVGELPKSPFGETFEAELSPQPGNVQVTGWVSASQYVDYLAAADVAVQLRTLSRGETSAAVLDCMNHGLPTIVNREGSMADLDSQAVLLLPEEFSDAQLAQALTDLWRNPQRRSAMGARGRAIVHTDHAPVTCAAAYASAIERFARHAPQSTRAVVAEIAKALPQEPHSEFVAALARAIAQNQPGARPARQLLVDITAWMREPVRSPGLPPLLKALLAHPPAGWRVEPAYLGDNNCWRYARRHTLRELACPTDLLEDDPLTLEFGDAWCTLGEATDAATPVPHRAIELDLDRLHLPLEGDAALLRAAVEGAATRAAGPRWYLDISELVQRDAHSGIQRVVKNHLLGLRLNPPNGVQVVPVYATADAPGYRVAWKFMLGLANAKATRGRDPLIDPKAGDLFFGLDLQPHIVPAQAGYLAELRARGVRTGFMVYDLLPVRLPQCFFGGGTEHQARWLRTIAQADFAVCISQAVADDLGQWLADEGLSRGMRITSVHLGGDLDHALPSQGSTVLAALQLVQIRSRPSFLMVGTLEPRKSHAAVLAAFDVLWSQGEDVALVIAGRLGWMVDELAVTLRTHPELGRRLIWIEDGSDEFLQQLYRACTCLVAASLGEGFGLPLVEAAQVGLPIIARDLPVFREVAGDHAFYFDDDASPALAAHLRDWLGLFRSGSHPASRGMPWLTWSQSTALLKGVLHLTQSV